MVGLVRNLFRTARRRAGFVFSRPLLAIQSDDWGRVGVRDREGYESLRQKGINLGEHSYDRYSLETAEDIAALASTLSKHRDSVGRPPCMVMNFCTANLDFKKMKAGGFQHIELLPIARGLPASWSRPGLFDAYHSGIREGVFYPAMHGLTHFCPVAIENALAKGGERADLLRTFWEAETPYIFWRTPWVGYEYWNPERPRSGFLSAELQRVQVMKARECFTTLFGVAPLSACAPGYFSNRDTRRVWAEAGIRIAQNGSSEGLNAPCIDHLGVLHLHRTIDLEPSHRECDAGKHLEITSNCFSRGLPVIISTHSINFHSTLKDFRTPSLVALDSLLTAIESKYPDLLYVNDQDLYEIVTQGAFYSQNQRVAVIAKEAAKEAATEEWRPGIVHEGVM